MEETKGTEFIVIPLESYNKLRETELRFNLLADHMRSVYGHGGSKFDFQDGLIKAVIGIPEVEGKEGESK